MILLVTSFLAGVLTVLAPCVVAILPALLVRSVDGKRTRSPFWVICGLAASVFLFSILLKSTTLLIDIPAMVWSLIGGGIVAIFGVITIFPSLWDQLAIKFNLGLAAQEGLAKASVRRGRWGDVVLGASLGPIFSACSPTYGLIVVTILPATPLAGLVYLTAYIAGLCTILTLIALLGRRLVRHLRWGINPHGLFRKTLGILLIVIGVMIIFGLDKEVLGVLVGWGWFDWQINLESGLMSR